MSKTEGFPIKNWSFTFIPVNNSHKNIILRWFQKKHVQEFYYGEGLKNTLNNLDLFCQGINHNSQYTFYHWLALCDDIPFGFMMTSPIEGPYNKNDDYNKWYIEGKKTFTLDLLIGEENFLGRGIAHSMIKQFIITQYSNADYFIIDPESENNKAIRVYEKAGFSKVDEFCPDFNPKPHVMMRLEVDDLISND